MPTLVKASLATKHVYQECGVKWNCRRYCSEAPSTELILKGKTPALFSPALFSKRMKRDLVREVKSRKKKKIPYGLGAFHMYMNHLTKPLPERYIHGYITTPDGGICFFTCVVFLLKLLDDPGVPFDDDTNYKHVEGEMNEWEVTVFVKAVLRGKSSYQSFAKSSQPLAEKDTVAADAPQLEEASTSVFNLNSVIPVLNLRVCAPSPNSHRAFAEKDTVPLDATPPEEALTYVLNSNASQNIRANAWDNTFGMGFPGASSSQSDAFAMLQFAFNEGSSADFLNPELYSGPLTMFTDAAGPPTAPEYQPYNLGGLDFNSFFGFNPYGGPDAHLFPPRKFAFFGVPARDFGSSITSRSRQHVLRGRHVPPRAILAPRARKTEIRHARAQIGPPQKSTW
ncbi:hypothetical protein B0H11DRAFT_2224722 [Mycena galericulata]|nr:hypothetical protein B0H11DRAFT_2224722 [Mycena galericulata]